MSITLTRKEMTQKLKQAFPTSQTDVLVEILDDVRQAELQRSADSQELKQGLAQLTMHVDRLTTRVDKLAEAQQRTDERLAAFEQRTDERFTQMANAVQKMAEGLTDLRQAVGGLNNRFGFDLEEFVAALLPPYLERHQGIANLVLQRGYFQLPHKHPQDLDEVDLTGIGERDEQPVTVLTECRTSIRGGEARNLVKKLKWVKASLQKKETLLVIVAMNVHPSAQKVGEKEGVLMVPYSRINRPGDFE